MCSVPSGSLSPKSAPNSQSPVTFARADGRIALEPIKLLPSGSLHHKSSFFISPRISLAASITASTNGLYPVHLHTFLCFWNQSLTSSLEGLIFSSKSALAETINPGVQKPHCAAPCTIHES